MLPATELGALIASRQARNKTLSAGNRFAGAIVAVERDSVMAKVEVACGPYRLISLMSSAAADDPELEPGVEIAVVIKATEVMVQR